MFHEVFIYNIEFRFTTALRRSQSVFRFVRAALDLQTYVTFLEIWIFGNASVKQNVWNTVML